MKFNFYSFIFTHCYKGVQVHVKNVCTDKFNRSHRAIHNYQKAFFSFVIQRYPFYFKDTINQLKAL